MSPSRISILGLLPPVGLCTWPIRALLAGQPSVAPDPVGGREFGVTLPMITSIILRWTTCVACAVFVTAVAVPTNAQNHAPVLDASKSPVLGTVNEDPGPPSGPVGTLVSSLVDFAVPAGQLDNVTDVDSGALLGIAISAADTANGTWFYSLNNGTTWTALGAVSVVSARLLAANANNRLYFMPSPNFNGTIASAITFQAWDQTSGADGGLAPATPSGGTTAFSTAADTAAITVNPVNDAPVLDASKSPVLGTVNEDPGPPSGPVGTLVSSLVDFAVPAGQLDNVTDVDSGALLGIAISAADTANGSCFYSLNNGTTWTALGAVSVVSARLLAANANNRLYFMPSPNFNGTIASAITFQAWDQTSGADGGLAPATPSGGTTAFSTAADTAAITVNPVNDAPVLDASKSPVFGTVNEDPGPPSGPVGTLVSSLVDFAVPAGQLDNVTDVDSGALLGIAISAADTANGSCFYSLNNGTTWTALGAVSVVSARLLAANANNRLYFMPSPNFNGTIASAITFQAWDQTSGADGGLAPATPSGGTTAFSTAADTAAITVIPIPVGRVPDGTTGSPLRVSRHSGDASRIDLSWSASCGAEGTDFAVYQGTIGIWYDHAPMLCSTSGTRTATVTPAAGNHYYLVVPLSVTLEGSYGTNSSGLEIPASTGACRAVQDLSACP